MNRWTRYLPALLLAIAVVGFAAGPVIRGTDDPSLPALPAAGETPQAGMAELNRQYRLIGTVFSEISRSYYQEVDLAEVATGGLKGMMAQLDPYSEFYVEEQDEGAVADLENTLTGTYSGIGATIAQRGGDLSIIAPMKQSPAERAGLMAGDIILEIDGEFSRYFSASKAASLIKGPRGTPVTLTIGREGFPDSIEITIIRDDIEVNDVSAAIFAAPGIAYIEIARFSRNTGQFLVQAIDELEKQQEIEGLILDLRGNPGGLLDEALAVVEPFLPAGELVVYTKGRIGQMNAQFTTQQDQRYAGRMAVLVNSASASASEIVAGALQDLDRAIIVGKTTFGKGLVQSVAELREGTYLRLTTGEYFTPSGRNLQRPLVRDDRGLLTIPNPTAPDTTEHPEFKSRNGRTVTGGGGVVPDIEADGITGDVLLYGLKFLDGMFLRYVNNYVNTRGIEEGASVQVDDRLLDDFKGWCTEQGFTFETPTEMQLDDLRNTAAAEHLADRLEGEIDALAAAITREKESTWERDRDGIALELKREFTTRLSGYGPGQLEYMTQDEQFQSALRVLRDTATYTGLLSGDAAGAAPGPTGADGTVDPSDPTADLVPEDPEQAVPVP